MKETILLLGGGLIAGIIVMFMKDFIFKKFKKEIPKLIPEDEKTKLLDLYNKGLVTLNHLKSLGIEVEQKIGTEVEKFSGQKLATGMLNITSPIHWAKDIVSIFNLRKLIIIGVIIGLIYGYGWYKGHQGVQPILDWHGKEEMVSLNDHYLHILKDGTMEILNSDKKTVLKKLTVKDFENLKKNSRPYGLILEPVVVGGFGISNAGAGIEGGVGVRYAKFFKWVADICLTNAGFYPFGISYKLTDNTALGLSVGTGFKKGERGFFERWLLKMTIKF
jgi:hypothetical protein